MDTRRLSENSRRRTSGLHPSWAATTKGLASLFILAALSGPPAARADGAVPITFSGVEHLGKPTDTSITINVVPDATVNIYYEYGTFSGVYTNQTAIEVATGGQPYEVVIHGLSSDTRYYYRMRYQVPGSDWIARDEHTFHTRRAAGSTFTVTSDSHVNIQLGNVALYRQALSRIAIDNPDFNIDLGDTFPMDGITSAAQAEVNYLNQRSADFMGRISPSAPIFLRRSRMHAAVAGHSVWNCASAAMPGGTSLRSILSNPWRSAYACAVAVSR